MNRKISENKVVEIYNWSNRRNFEIDKSTVVKHSKEFNFIYFGNVGKLSGLQQVIDAFSLINSNRVRFIIAGEGSEKERLLENVNSRKILNVEFHSVDVGDEYEFLSMANVCILPMTVGSSSFSIPSKLITYTGYGLPVLGYCDYKSGVWDILENISDEFLVESGNVKGLAKAINEMSLLPQSRLEILSKKSFKYYQENYDRSNNLKRLASVVLR